MPFLFFVVFCFWPAARERLCNFLSIYFSKSTMDLLGSGQPSCFCCFACLFVCFVFFLLFSSRKSLVYVDNNSSEVVAVLLHSLILILMFGILMIIIGTVMIMMMIIETVMIIMITIGTVMIIIRTVMIIMIISSKCRYATIQYMSPARMGNSVDHTRDLLSKCRETLLLRMRGLRRTCPLKLEYI